jgi:hypothetical protein
MVKLLKADTLGEQLFLNYLSRFDIRCERWSKRGGKQPDWLVNTSAQQVVVENKDIEWGEVDLKRFRIASENGGVHAEAAEFPVIKTHDRLVAALDKLSAIANDMCYMPVIFNNAGQPYTNDISITQALYGPTQLSVLVSASGAQSDTRHEPKESMTEECDERFGFFGRLGSSRRMSAVAVVWEQNDKHSCFTDFVLSYVLSGERCTGMNVDEEHSWLENEFDKIYESVPKLCIYHNPFATVPLSGDAFAFDSDCRQVWYDRQQQTFVMYGDQAPIF